MAGLRAALVADSLDLRSADRGQVHQRSFQQPASRLQSTGAVEAHLFTTAEAQGFFGGSRRRITGELDVMVGPFHTLVVVSGRGVMTGPFGSQAIATGETFAVPAGMEYRLEAHEPLDVLRLSGPYPG